jgi:hypothetical protein
MVVVKDRAAIGVRLRAWRASITAERLRNMFLAETRGGVGSESSLCFDSQEIEGEVMFMDCSCFLLGMEVDYL